MAVSFTVKSQSLPQLRPELQWIKSSFNVNVEVQEKTEDEHLSWIKVTGQGQKEAKDYITTFCNPECTQLLVCPAHFGEFLEDTRRRLEVNYKVVCRRLDDLSMEVCGTTLDVTLAASAFEEIINQFDDSVTKDLKSSNHDEILDSHLHSFAQNDEWQGLDVEASMNLPSHVKRALLSVLSEEPLDEKEECDRHPDKKNSELGEVFHSPNVSEDDDEGVSTLVCSTVKKKPRPSSSLKIAARFPVQGNSLDGSYIDDQESVIFMGMKEATNKFDESIIGGNIPMSPKSKKMRLDSLDTIVIDSPKHETLIEVLMDVGYERWVIEAAQATLPEHDRSNHTKILSILQSQKNENKLKSLTLPSEMRKSKAEKFSLSKMATPLPKQEDLSSLSLEQLERKHQDLINLVSNRQPRSMITPMRVKQETFGSPSLPQSTPLVKFNADVDSDSDSEELDETVIDARSKKVTQPHNDFKCSNQDVEYIGELKAGVKTSKTEKKSQPPTEDWIYVSSSSSESSGEGVQKIKVTSEKSFVAAIETELAARQESNLLTQKAELEEEMKKQQDDIMKELEKRYEEQNRQLRLENERLQKQQEESIKELRQMMEKQNKEQLKKDEELKKKLSKKEQKDKEIKELEEQTKRMQKALKEQEQTMKQLQQQQQKLASLKTNLPMQSPIRIEPKVSGTSGGLRPIVIDGSNVAMTHGKKKVFSCRGIALCVKYFQDRGHKEITVFLPHWRKTQDGSRDGKPIKDRHILDDLERKEILHFTPSRKVKGRFITSYDDRFIIRLASMNDGVIVSNDNYRDLMCESEKWKKVIEERLLMYNIVGDIFLVPDDPLGRNGPTLNQFLQKQPLNTNEPANLHAEPIPQQLLQPTLPVADPPQVIPPVKWNQDTRAQHFPRLGATLGRQPPEHQADKPEAEQTIYLDMNTRQNVRQSMHARTEPFRHFRPPDTNRQRHKNSKKDIDHRKPEQTPPQHDRISSSNDMEELTRVFDRLATIFPNQEEKIMTVLEKYPNIKDVKKYENMIRNPEIIEIPEKKQNVRTLPMYAKLRSVFPDSDSKIVELLTKYPKVDDMNALCGMLLE